MLQKISTTIHASRRSFLLLLAVTQLFFATHLFAQSSFSLDGKTQVFDTMPLLPTGHWLAIFATDDSDEDDSDDDQDKKYADVPYAFIPAGEPALTQYSQSAVCWRAGIAHATYFRLSTIHERSRPPPVERV
jgi:hypothetical protein